MQLKRNDINQLAELQKRLTAVMEDILKIKGLLEQLTTDRCSVQISFKMVNEALKAKHQSENAGEELLQDPMQRLFREAMNGGGNTQFQGILGELYGPRHLQEPYKQHHCFDFSEGDSIRVLSIALEAKRAEKNTLISEIRSLVKKNIATYLHLDQEQPIREL